MTPEVLDLRSLRAAKARLARHIGKKGYEASIALMLVFGIMALIFYYFSLMHFAYLSGAVALLCAMLAAWYKYDLQPLPPHGNSLTDRLSGDVLGRFNPVQPLTPLLVWQTLRMHWQMNFMMGHLLLSRQLIETLLSEQQADMGPVWAEAMRLQELTRSPAIEPGHLIAAMLLTSPRAADYLTHVKLKNRDVEFMVEWLGRLLAVMRAEKPYFGGVGRDWANGFTPLLNHFGYNISLAVERHSAHFGWLTTSPGVGAIKNAFSQGASAVALIGDAGVGKTSHVQALAQVLLAEKQDRNLTHRQIVELDPSVILSAARRPGELEDIVLRLVSETTHAGHIMLFLDDAQLFFSNGNGSFDLTGILLPVLQARSIQIIMAMTPHDYQQLKAHTPAFANLLAPVTLSEPAEDDVMRIAEDAALTMEQRNKLMISYAAVREAYRLSGRYLTDIAYPGKVIQLLEQSLAYAEQGQMVTPASVQQAIEQAHGVKVAAAAPVEADMLLNLEDKIHERMINQKQAVSVVASALRRARAGVTNPNRPLGSFLFLGPTGVGKTELAKALAAIYFKSDASLIRLDMSEYQRPEDVQRLLSNGEQEANSLIMAVRRQPFSVVLLDEIEKAHPNILNLLLQLLDEGQLTDSGGRPASFKDCIIIATSNAGANFIRERIAMKQEPSAMQDELLYELMHDGQFKPELLNRFDEIVVFRPLNEDELAQVVKLMVTDINTTLSTQNISVELTEAAIHKVVSVGYDARLGARPMRRALQRMVEDSIAGRILRGEATAGDHIVLDEPDLVTTT